MPRQMLFLGRWLLWLALSQQAVTPLHAAEPARFNPGFLNKTLGEVDLSRFSEGSPLSAGIYPSDIYINQVWLGQAEVRFKELDSNNDIALCFDENLLQMSKLKPSLIPPMQAKRLRDTSSCVTSQQLHPAIQWHYKMNSLSLEITLPQSLQTIAPRGETNPHKAQSGATVATLSYNLNSYHTRYNHESQDNRYLGLNGGANLGSWRLRHQSTLSKSNDDATTWDNLATYAERSLVNMTSHLRLGQGWTSGELFDSIGYQGVNLATDSRMLPSSQRGFAPTVRGNARTNARVTIEQNGKLLYETTVSPGSFIIDDLYPTGYGGDLQVTIHEADGQQQQFRVPYAAVPGLLRNDTTLYSATVG
ncbi:MAG: fimbria/pilus outer membrane usher protein, partial [Aeromonadaceae bacterium]